MAAILRGLRHGLADWLRLVPAAALWNTRKTLHLRRGRPGPCPCQHPSDDNVPGRIGCEAMAHWRDPARFRLVCPLLKQTPGGWRCSVARDGVRPFWGRAAGWIFAAMLALYLAGVTAVFAVMRGYAGTPVAWSQVAWPGRWPEIKHAQARGFFTGAIVAFRAGHLPEAHLALLTARAQDPGNYDVNLLLAQISMYQGNWDYADGIFLALLRSHPGQRQRTGQVLHDTLLALGRGGRLAHLALRMAVEDKEHAAVWIRSLLLGLRLPGRTDDWPDLGDENLRPLAPHARRLIRAQVLARSQDRDGARAELHAPHPGPFNSVYMQQHVEMLARLDDPGTAQTMLDFYGPMLGDFEQAALQYTLEKLRRDDSAAEAALRGLLRLKPTAAQVERLAARLIAHPGAGGFRMLHARLVGDAALAAQADGPTLWLTGLACGAPAEAAHWQSHGGQKFQEIYPSITAVNFASRDRADPAAPANLVNALTFPWEISCALLARGAAPDAR